MKARLAGATKGETREGEAGGAGRWVKGRQGGPSQDANRDRLWGSLSLQSLAASSEGEGGCAQPWPPRSTCPTQPSLLPLPPLAPLPTLAGHSLLKKKADALNMRFRQILKKIVDTKEEMGRVMKASFFSLAQVGPECSVGA